ncbi:uncharacterized protein LOC123865722 [Maniola jurtina]|uniref:uncharacterized protein LOC123865722 n=1 Tax=Maniola jurtina TaxID=191418 RepID=UPI001E689BDC|nr:uncharacterized protein LOC123865722 [Maniola jurtina]
MMKLMIIFLVTIVTPALCQYAIQTGLRPDVRFGEGNDRFDITNLIRQEKKHFKPNLDSQSEEFRRRSKPRDKKKYYKANENDLPWPKLLNTETGRSILRNRIKNKLEDHVNNLANTVIHKIRGMRRNEEFAYHDDMNSEGDGEDFNTNLRAFDHVQDFNDDENDYVRRQNRLQDIVNKLHGTNQTRRMAMDPEKEILFHYAFPVDMKIEGFLQAPVN